MAGSPVPGVELKSATVNTIRLRYAEIGQGPLVLFCHGWPESWYSWRHQLSALGTAGFRCVAPDMRGYGGSEAPEPIDQYTLFNMVGDMAELVKALSDKN
jgi:pimeloyl-ACP methyl ester carboxylesterase